MRQCNSQNGVANANDSRGLIPPRGTRRSGRPGAGQQEECGNSDDCHAENDESYFRVHAALSITVDDLAQEARKSSGILETENLATVAARRAEDLPKTGISVLPFWPASIVHSTGSVGAVSFTFPSRAAPAALEGAGSAFWVWSFGVCSSH